MLLAALTRAASGLRESMTRLEVKAGSGRPKGLRASAERPAGIRASRLLSAGMG